MDESKSVVPGGAYGIPKWIMKKGMRYEVDDFIVSPPSHEEGEFLRLRYGRRSTTDNPLQGTGQEGLMTVEVKNDHLQFSTPSSSTTISINPGGLSVVSSAASTNLTSVAQSSTTSTPLTTPESAQDITTTHPLLVLPMNIEGESKYVKTDTVEPKTNTEFLGFSPSSEEAAGAQCNISHNFERENRPYAHDNTSTLVEKVRALSLFTSPIQSIEPSPVTSPRETPLASPLGQRRVLKAMDPPRKISAHSYFFTKTFQSSQSDAASKLQQERGMDLESPTHNQLQGVTIPEEALNPKMMGRKRRPKPSALREMNFWAPTSM